MDEEKAVERTSTGQFPTGVSGNPLGRPKGSRNKVTMIKLMAEQAVRDGNMEDMIAVAELVITQALEGDQKSQKLVWDGIMSKSSTDDKTKAADKVEINIGRMEKQEPIDKGTIIIDQEVDENEQRKQPDEPE